MDFEDVRTQAVGDRIGTPRAMEIVRHSITIRSGLEAGRTWVLEGPHIAIGTAPTNSLVVRDETVSRHHCEIVVKGGRRLLRDLGSTNGTLVEGIEIVEAVLPERARITLGELVLECSAVTHVEPLSPAREDRFGELVGGSEGMRRTFTLMSRIAPTNLSVLLLGETGTGKELAARSLHAASARATKPFVVVDCAAIQRNLVESQLFGHERGAFTGAERQHRGAFEQADGGTLFFDEIGELPLDLQPRLLRALERREVTRLGGTKATEVDVRVIAATHRDLALMVRGGTFREDLYYRLSEMLVILPPLRERQDDVPRVAAAILEASFGAAAPRLSADALAILSAERWPGNVRELRNALRRAAAFADHGVIDARALASASAHSVRALAPPATGAGESVEVHPERPLKEARETWIEQLETRYLREVLARFGDDLDAGAEHVGVHRKSYQRLLRERGITRE